MPIFTLNESADVYNYNNIISLRMQTLYTKAQTDHFQKVMDTILRKYYNFSVPLMECINLALEIDAKSNLESAERFLLKLIQQNYLTKMTFGVSYIRIEY